MKRKILFFVTLLIILGLITMQSCKKAAPVATGERLAAMPAEPLPAVDAVIPFTGSGQTINLTWAGTATDAILWDVYFGKKAAPALAVSGITSNSYTATITKGGVYYWQVSTTDAFNVTTTSPVWTFDVNSNPNVPSGPVPATAAIGVSKSVRLSWNGSDPEGDALTYDVYLGKTAVPTTIVATGISDTTFAVSAPLSTSATYYWKIVAHDPYGGISESPVWSFTTTANLITALEGDYNADEPAEAYSYGITFTAATTTTITTDNYWNSGWNATFTVDLIGKTYSMPKTVWGTYSGVESGIVNTSTGTITGTYTIWNNTTIVEQGVHTYTKL
jgi:hypothetical protein